MSAEHPAPWKWDMDDRCGDTLLDANGTKLIFLGFHCSPDGDVEVASPVVAALTAAAPEMEALLRMAVAACSIVMDGETEEARRERFDGLRKAIYEAGPLLARIDAAGKAGT